MKVKQHPRCNRSNRSSASGSEQLDFRSEPKPPPLYRIKIGSCSTAPGGQAYVIGKTEHFSQFWPVAMKLSGSLDDMQRTAALVHRDSTGVDKNKNNSRRLPSSYPPPPPFFFFFFFFTNEIQCLARLQAIRLQTLPGCGACLSVGFLPVNVSPLESQTL